MPLTDKKPGQVSDRCDGLNVVNPRCFPIEKTPDGAVNVIAGVLDGTAPIPLSTDGEGTGQ